MKHHTPLSEIVVNLEFINAQKAIDEIAERSGWDAVAAYALSQVQAQNTNDNSISRASLAQWIQDEWNEQQITIDDSIDLGYNGGFRIAMLRLAIHYGIEDAIGWQNIATFAQAQAQNTADEPAPSSPLIYPMKDE